MIATSALLVALVAGVLVAEEVALVLVIRHQRKLARVGSEAAQAWAILPWCVFRFFFC